MIKAYKMQLLKNMSTDDQKKRKQFCVDVPEKIEDEFNNNRLAYSDEATFYTNGKVKVNFKRKKIQAYNH